MSASLVGSEMCIRDSSAAGAAAVAAAGAPSAPASAIATAGSSLGAAAVSYTHLTLPTICSV
eukprot:8712281-Alexandrium_andersonii.AAC.1